MENTETVAETIVEPKKNVITISGWKANVLIFGVIGFFCGVGYLIGQNSR